MSKKIIKIGSSYGVTLSKNVLLQAGLQIGDPVTIDYNPDSNCIQIEPAADEMHMATIQRAQALVKKYRKQLDKLND